MPARVQLSPLVPHQRDQRADNDRQLLARQPGQLVAEALAAAGRHDDQRIAALQSGDDGLALPVPPLRVAQLVQQLVGSLTRLIHQASHLRRISGGWRGRRGCRASCAGNPEQPATGPAGQSYCSAEAISAGTKLSFSARVSIATASFFVSAFVSSV